LGYSTRCCCDAIVIGSDQPANPLSKKLADGGWTVALIAPQHKKMADSSTEEKSARGEGAVQRCSQAFRVHSQTRNVGKMLHANSSTEPDATDGSPMHLTTNHLRSLLDRL
jgi:hypothetical protein